MGVAISNVKGWRTKKALFLVGDGNAGKSQLKSLTEWLLGKNNYIGMDLSEIEARFGTGSLYLQWCRANNNGYAKSAGEFREESAAHLHTSFAEMTTRVHGNTYYKGWTLIGDTQDDYQNIL